MPDMMLSSPCAPEDEPEPNSTLLAYNYQCNGTVLNVEFHTKADCSGSVSADCQMEMGVDGPLQPSGCHKPFVLDECTNLIGDVSLKFTGSCPSGGPGCFSYYYEAEAACDFDNASNTDFYRYCSGACNAALMSAAAECTATSTEVVAIKSMADGALAICSGCMSHYYVAMAACDFDNPSNTDHSQYCSGACNTALTSAAAECTSSEEEMIKSMADQALAMCSGCMGHALQYSSDCAGLQDLVEDFSMSGLSAMSAVVCGGGACYDRLTQASNDCDASIPNEAPMWNMSNVLLKLCSGCPALMVNALDSCPGLAEADNPTGADISRWCSGACKAAVNSVSSGCDASQGDMEGDFKREADQLLTYCQPPVVLTLTASGDVGDYADTTAIAASIATSAGVDVSLVTIEVTPGSVVITATIATPPSTTPAAVQSSLGSALGTDAATASAALGITVEAAPTLAITPYPVPSPSPPPPAPPPSPLAPPPPSTDDGGLPMGAIIGIAVGGDLVLLLAVVVGIYCMKKANKKAVSPR